MLARQILEALRRAISAGRLDVAEHLLRALETLEQDAESDGVVEKAFLLLVDPPRSH